MLSDFFPAIIMQIRLSRIFSSIPYRWNSKLFKLEYDTRRYYKIRYWIGFVIHATYATFMFLNFTHMWVVRDAGQLTVDQILSIGWICCHCGSGVLRFSVSHKMNELLTLFNSFAEFERILCNEVPERVKGHWLIKGLCYMGCGASLGLPSFICMMLLYNPCLPPMIGYNLFDCRTYLDTGIIYWIVKAVFAFNVFTWFNAFGMAYFLMFPAFYLPMICLKEYFGTLEKITNRNIENRSAVMDDFQRNILIKIYRRMQLLVVKFNDCYQTVFFPATLLACMLSGGTSLFVVIKLHAETPVQGLGFFALKISCLFVLFNQVFSFGGIIHEKSKDMKTNWMQVKNLEKHKVFQRELWSISPLKVKYGDIGFLDRLSPLVMNAIVVDMTLNFVLLF